ncbi:MAG TPA: hypothetical protein VMW17_03190 [Candidatus Binatia bacterium]|nr:hypothetical protein [Candidatus Binatia bacterium]
MAKWSSENKAHQQIWLTLFLMEELQVNFDDAAALTMKQLAFHRVAGDSADMLRLKAEALAAELDNRFRGFAGAQYEPTSNQRVATDAMVATLLDDTKTVEDLGEVVDANYHFRGE